MNGKELGGKWKLDMRNGLEKLRKIMQKEKIDYYYVTSADDHHSEYVDDYFKVREYLSGFTGSNGDLLVGKTFAGLWTDGRYFIQAERELREQEITLFRMGEEGVPSIEQYLEQNLQEGENLAFDGRCISIKRGEILEKAVKKKGGKLIDCHDLISRIWEERPKRKAEKVFVLPEELWGRSLSQKLALVREALQEQECSNLVLTKLDDIMWLYNIRGKDIACNPVALSYSMITETECYLFLQKEGINVKTEEYLLAGKVTLLPYDDFWTVLERQNWQGKVLLDKETSSFSLGKCIESKAQIVWGKNPTEGLKARKTQDELMQMRKVYLQDSLAVCRFMRWVKEHAGKVPMTELSAGKYMDELRRKTEGFLDLSFPTICAYQENAAMMHYQATVEQNKEIQGEGVLLVDSGGQYLGGTTDVTRTYGLGSVSEIVKEQFTAVVMGMLRLLNGKFLYGCTGRNLDILARGPLWDRGIDYKCGTGHGIGYMLNVHEGPQNIRWRFTQDMQEAVLEEGMVISNEPGVYKEGSHGIRIENIMVVQKAEKNGDGQFMVFEGLTFVPIDRDLLLPELLENKDRENLNRYHQEVYEKIAPLMEEDEREWLRRATAQL